MRQISIDTKACDGCPCLLFNRNRPWCNLFDEEVDQNMTTEFKFIKRIECLLSRPQIIVTGPNQTVVVTEESLREIKNKLESIFHDIDSIDERVKRLEAWQDCLYYAHKTDSSKSMENAGHKIKPCPFCGSEAVAYFKSEGTILREFVCCENDKCGVRGPIILLNPDSDSHSNAQKKAIEAWNKRS